jgi:hypothetical protein
LSEECSKGGRSAWSVVIADRKGRNRRKEEKNRKKK